MKKYILIFLIIILIIGGILFFKKSKHIPDISYPKSSDYVFYSIGDLKNKNLNSNIYNTKGYIVKKFVCPSGSDKPCMKNNIVISENNKLIDTYNLSNSELIIFLKNEDESLSQFKLGEKYEFSIKITENNSTGEPVNDIELIGYNTIE